jgi:uncharacterized protein (TIGR00661 family)
MKILFAIQGTGNGHISRAREVIPHLLRYGELDILISGTQADVSLPYAIKYQVPGISFTFGKHGGVDFWDTFTHLKPVHFIKDMQSIPVETYDLVINDFEPVTAWACKIKHKPCIGLSHQSSFLSDKTPRPLKKDGVAENIFKQYAPVTDAYGFHFERYDSFISTPVIRSDIRKLETSNKGHITVYLPAHGDAVLLKHFVQIKDVEWEVFSKHTSVAYTIENVHIKPILNNDFTQSLASSNGLITAGGFESPAEAMFLGKKVLTIPMIGQYEQQCNALSMQQMGVTLVKQIDDHFVQTVTNWVQNAKPLNVNFPDVTGEIIAALIAKHNK